MQTSSRCCFKVGLAAFGVLAAGALVRRRALAETPTAVQSPVAAATPPPPTPAPAPPGSVWWRAGFSPVEGGGRWVVEDGKPRIAGPEVPLERLRQCVRGRHWAFIGDSVLRYTWMTMVALLDGAVGHTLDDVSRDSNQFWASFASPEPDLFVAANAKRNTGTNGSLVWQKEWPTWGAYLAGSTARFEGRMCCDCFRCAQPDHSIRRRKLVSAKTMRARRNGYWLTQRENRYYGGDGWNASFMFMHGDTGGYGDAPGWQPGCTARYGHANSTVAPSTQAEAAACTQCPCAPQWPPPDSWKEGWRGRLHTAAGAVAGGGKADVLVVNGGLWHPRWAVDGGAGVEAVKAAEAALRPSGRAVWMTPTQQCQRAPPGPADEAGALAAVNARIAQGGPWSLLNASRVTGELKEALGVPLFPAAHMAPTIPMLSEDVRKRCAAGYVDASGHMQPRVYRELLGVLVRAAGCTV